MNPTWFMDITNEQREPYGFCVDSAAEGRFRQATTTFPSSLPAELASEGKAGWAVLLHPHSFSPS